MANPILDFMSASLAISSAVHDSLLFSFLDTVSVDKAPSSLVDVTELQFHLNCIFRPRPTRIF